MNPGSSFGSMMPPPFMYPPVFSPPMGHLPPFPRPSGESGPGNDMSSANRYMEEALKMQQQQMYMQYYQSLYSGGMNPMMQRPPLVPG